MMLALASDAALRREELCSLRTDDLDPAHRTSKVRRLYGGGATGERDSKHWAFLFLRALLNHTVCMFAPFE